MSTIKGNTAKRSLTLILASILVMTSLSSCFGKGNKTDDGSVNGDDTAANEEIQLPENEDKKEEIIINENYADSELYVFEGTIDEIYDDGSMLVYSPSFGINFNYMVIVEKDASTKAPSFEPKVNQHIKFSVYSAVKKSEPLTVVAYDMELVKEVSTQKADEEARKADVKKELDKILKEHGVE